MIKRQRFQRRQVICFVTNVDVFKKANHTVFNGRFVFVAGIVFQFLQGAERIGKVFFADIHVGEAVQKFQLEASFAPGVAQALKFADCLVQREQVQF